MKSVKKQISEIIRDRRRQLGMTQMEVAQMLGYETVQFFSMIERGISNCPYQTLGALSVILNLPKERFISLILEEFRDHLSDNINAGSKMIKVTRNTLQKNVELNK